MSTKNHAIARIITMIALGMALLPAQATYYFTTITNAATGASVTSTLDPDGTPVATMSKVYTVAQQFILPNAVEQTVNPDSTNAVSSKAVYDAIDTLDSLLEDANGEVYKKMPDTVPDLSTFKATSQTSGNYTSVIYAKGLFVACPDDGGGIFWSENGTNWVAATGTGDAWFQTLMYANGRFIAGCAAYTNRDNGLWYSEDGKDWRQSGIGSPSYNALTYGNGVSLAGSSSSNCYKSTNGVDWTSVYMGDRSIRSLSFGRGLFMSLTESAILVSSNADDWTVIANTSADFIVFANNQFFIATDSGRIYLSDGTSLIQGANPLSEYEQVYGLDAIGRKVYLWAWASDEQPSLYSTKDGLSWVKENGSLPFVGQSMASDGHIAVAGARHNASGVTTQGLWVSASEDGYSYTPLATKEDAISSGTALVDDRLRAYVPRAAISNVAVTIDTSAMSTPNAIVSALGNMHDALEEIATNNNIAVSRGFSANLSQDASLTNTILSGEISFSTPMYTADSVDALFNSSKQTLYDPLDTRVSEVESSLVEKADACRVVPWIIYTNDVKVVLDKVEVTSSNVTWWTSDGLNYLRRDPSATPYVECVWKTSFSANTLNGSLDDTELSFGDWYDLIKFTRVSSEIYSPVVYTEDIVPLTDFILENKADKSRCSYYWTVTDSAGKTKPFSIYSREVVDNEVHEIWRENYSLENKIEIYYSEGNSFMLFGSTYETVDNIIVYDEYSRSTNSIFMAGRYFSKVMNAVSGARNLVDVLPTTASTNSITLVNEAYNYLSQDNASVYSITLPLLTSDGTARVSYFVFQCTSASGITVNVATRSGETLIYPSGDSSALTPSAGTNIYKFEEVMPNKFLVTKTLGVAN